MRTAHRRVLQYPLHDVELLSDLGAGSLALPTGIFCLTHLPSLSSGLARTWYAHGREGRD